MKIFLVCLFSFLGASLRFAITSFFNKHKFPYGTLVCNSLACVTMGTSFAVLTSFCYDVNMIQNTMYAFLGALSTFSAFSHDTWLLFENKGLLIAIANIMLNLCFGIILFILGFAGASLIL